MTKTDPAERLVEAVNISLPGGSSKKIEEAALRAGLSRPEWCREVLDAAIDFDSDVNVKPSTTRSKRFTEQQYVAISKGRHRRISMMAAREGITVADWLRKTILAAIPAANSPIKE